MSKLIMHQALNKLDFKFIPQNGIYAWSKIYKGFILFVGENTIDDVWLCEFERQNSDMKICLT